MSDENPDDMEGMTADPDLIRLTNQLLQPLYYTQERIAGLILELNSQGSSPAFFGCTNRRQFRLDRNTTLKLVLRLKIMSGMDIEAKTPQVGYVRLNSGGIAFDAVFQMRPTRIGEEISVRKLWPDDLTMPTGLGKLPGWSDQPENEK